MSRDFPFIIDREDELQGTLFSQALSEFLGTLQSDETEGANVTVAIETTKTKDDCLPLLKDCVRMCHLTRKVSADEAYSCAKKLLDICAHFDLDRLGCVRPYIDALREAGAIASEMYLTHIDIRYHIQALEWEIDTLRKAIEMYISPSAAGAKEHNDDILLLSRCFNAVAVSSYRLRNYSVAIPFIELACRSTIAAGVPVGKGRRPKTFRNRSTIRYAYAQDLRDGLTGFNNGVPQGSSLVAEQFALAKQLAVNALTESGERSWDACITLAECEFMTGERVKAIRRLTDLKDGIMAQLKPLKRPSDQELPTRVTQYTTLSRCCYQLARFLSMSGELGDEQVDNSEAIGNAYEALLYRCWVLDYGDIDVRKAVDLIDRLEPNGPLANHDKEVLRELTRARGSFGVGGVPKVSSIVDRIVRGDEVSACDVLGISAESMTNLLKEIGCMDWSDRADGTQSGDPTRPVVPYAWDAQVDLTMTEWTAENQPS